MASWTSYSYINLAARGMDAVSYLGCAIRHYNSCNVSFSKQSSGQYLVTAGFNVIWVLIPVADVKDGALLRGDRLPGGGVGPQGLVRQSIVTHPDLISGYLNNDNGRYRVRFMSTNQQGTSADRVQNTNSSMAVSMFDARMISLNYKTLPTGSERPFSWDETTEKATFNLSVTGKTLKDYLGAVYSQDFSGNILNIDDSAIFTQTIEMNCPTPTESYAIYTYELSGQRETGDPIDAPIFKIPVTS